MNNGTLFIDLYAMYEQIRQKYLCKCGQFTQNCRCNICLCGNLRENCDCPEPDPRVELYDDPARGA